MHAFNKLLLPFLILFIAFHVHAASLSNAPFRHYATLFQETDPEVLFVDAQFDRDEFKTFATVCLAIFKRDDFSIPEDDFLNFLSVFQGIAVFSYYDRQIATSMHALPLDKIALEILNNYLRSYFAAKEKRESSFSPYVHDFYERDDFFEYVSVEAESISAANLIMLLLEQYKKILRANPEIEAQGEKLKIFEKASIKRLVTLSMNHVSVASDVFENLCLTAKPKDLLLGGNKVIREVKTDPVRRRAKKEIYPREQRAASYLSVSTQITLMHFIASIGNLVRFVAPLTTM